MKIEINNLSNEDVNELNNIFDSWKKIKTTSEFSRWCSIFVNVNKEIKNTELKIINE